MAKAKPGKPTPKKIGPDGLPCKPAAGVAGGPIEDVIEGTGLQPGKGVKGEKALPTVKRGKTLKPAKK